MPEDKNISNNSSTHHKDNLSRFLPKGRSLDDFPADLVEEQKSILYSTKEIIGKIFEVIEELGFGNVGAVYRVKDLLMHGQEKALKVILPSLIRGKEARERFIAGAQLTQSLRHDAIVSVFDIREDLGKDIFFFTMEFLEGENLAAYLELKGERLKFDEACDIVLQICEALSYAHEKGVIHRDIKPQNIFILSGGRVKILDFGFAKLLSPGRLACSSMGLGTAYYMAPEQSMGKEVDARTDIFSLGAVFYQMLAGQVPMGIFQLPSAINSEIPASINPVITKCLNQNPEDRYHDAASLAEDIKKVQKGVKPVVKERVSKKKKEDESKKERKGNGKKRLATIITVVVLLVISGIYLLKTANDKPGIPLISDSEQSNETPEIAESLMSETDISSVLSRSPKKEEISSNSEDERLNAAPEIIKPVMHEAEISSKPQKEEEIALLLLEAEERIRVKKYTSPKSDNAFDILSEILKKDPDNVQAKNMINEIKDKYVGLGKRAFNNGDYNKAEIYYEKALFVLPENKDAKIGLKSVKAINKEEDKKRIKFAGEMVFVKGGCYQMGDIFGDGESDEKPVHEVCVDDFYIGMYEVTQGQWNAIMGSNPSYFRNCGNNCPVENISYNDIQNFMKKLRQRTKSNYRLPTEAEWEYACRSRGRKEKYSGGGNAGGVAWYNANSGSRTHLVGQKNANGPGIHDMSGNVWEWVADWYNKDFYLNSTKNNPAGLDSGTYRVKRGGSWSFASDSLRCSYRVFSPPDYRYEGDGFRLVRTK